MSLSVMKLKGGLGLRKLKVNPDADNCLKTPTMLDRWLNLTNPGVNITSNPKLDPSKSSARNESTYNSVLEDPYPDSSDEIQRARQQSTILQFAALILRDADACLRKEEYDQAFEYYCKACKLWRKSTEIIPADILMYYGQHPHKASEKYLSGRQKIE